MATATGPVATANASERAMTQFPTQPATATEPLRIRLHRLSYVPAAIGLTLTVAALVAKALDLVDLDYRVFGVGVASFIRIVMVATTEVTVTADQIRMKWGWIWLADKTIPLDRVQDIQVERSITARVLGLVQVEVNSAGGAGSIKLSYLDLAHAELLKRELNLRGLDSAANVYPGAPTGSGSSPERPIHALSMSEFAKAQTSALVSMLLGVSVLGLVAIAIAQTLSSSVAVSVSAVLAITAVGIGIVGLIWALSTLSLFLTLSPGRSTMTAGLLRVEQGVLTLRTTTTPMKRVQLCRLRCGPVGQLMNWIKVEYSSADAAIGTGQQPRQVLALAVGIDQALDVAEAVLDVAECSTIPMEPFGPTVLKTSVVRSIITAMTWWIGLGLAAFGAAAIVRETASNAGEWSRSILLLGGAGGALGFGIWVLGSLLVGTVRARRSAIGLGADSLLVRDGFWLLQTKVLPLAKLQAVEVSESLSQRIVHSASLRVDVAGTAGRYPVTARDIPFAEAKRLQSLLISRASGLALPDGV